MSSHSFAASKMAVYWSPNTLADHTDRPTTSTIYVGRMCHENDPLDILYLNLNKYLAYWQVMYSLFKSPVLGLSVAYLM